jgi:hypothetical protein
LWPVAGLAELADAKLDPIINSPIVTVKAARPILPKYLMPLFPSFACYTLA